MKARAALASAVSPFRVISNDIRAEILERLRRAEAEHGVRILFAVESGSRAWGFASPDSDYDVRFVYVHEPLWYQAVDLEEKRDVIEYPIVDDIDLNGWDLRKALRLFWNSNPAFIEWIQSPIAYLERDAFRRQAIDALPTIYRPEKGIYHYRSMAKKNFRGYLQEPMVRLKKYFYVMRPLLAARWIGRTQSAPPIEFAKLMTAIEGEPEVLSAVNAILEKKRATAELGLAESVPVLNAFIEAALGGQIVEAPKKPRSSAVVDLLNSMFHRSLLGLGGDKSLDRTREE
jgi:predicted nucleotidyltransferase